MNEVNKSRTFPRGIKPRGKDLHDTHSPLRQAAGYSGKVRDKITKDIDRATILSASIEGLPDGMALFNAEKKVILANTSMMKMTGLPKEGFYLSELSRLFQPYVNLETELDKILTTTITTITTITIQEIPLANSFYQVCLATVFGAHQDIVGGALTLHDITKEKEIDRMKSEFISLASHQLRTPLTSINWYIEMLESGDVGQLNEKQKEFLAEVYRGSKRMMKLVNDLLNLSRLETGRLKIEPVPTDLVALIKSIDDEVGRLAKARQCAIVVRTPTPPVPQILVDPQLLRQVFSNIIMNAIRYSPKEKKCTVEVKIEQLTIDNLPLTKQKKWQMSNAIGQRSRVRGQIVVSVTDHGIGIPQDAQGRLFEKFFRADNARTMESEGSGLGLYIAKLILDASGGTIWLESEEGKGTTFYVAMPISGMRGKEGEKGLSV